MADHAPVAVGDYPDAGIRVGYFEAPHRHYRITTQPPCPIALKSEKAVSVTTALGVLDKSGPLMHYAERLTSEGLRTLVRRNGYRVPSDARVPRGAKAFRLPPRVTDSTSNGVWLYRWKDIDAVAKDDPKSLIRLKKDTETITGARFMLGHLAQLGLDHRSQTSEAALRGVDVHKVWEEWVEQQKIPNVADYPENRHGYIRSLAKAIMALQPKAVETESVVGSAVHLFAGRLDTVVVLDTTEGLSMIDIKTSKDVYANTHFPQLAGYEIARQECGLTPTVRQGILRIDGKGDFDLDRDLRWSDAEPEDFLAVLAAYKSQQKWARRNGA